MAKTPSKHRQPWTGADEKLLRQLIRENTPTRVMGIKLECTPASVQQHANDLGLSTKPFNQRTNKRNKK